MSAPELRPYQVDVIERVRGEITAGRRRILLVAATGSGKTVIAGEIIAKTVARPAGAIHDAPPRACSTGRKQAA
jgi:superfamily II DNA or RNA helicase